jgi:hypothetical protein
MYKKSFNKENVLKEIKENGNYTLKYHLNIGGKYTPVTLRGAIINENGEDKLIIGIKQED